jgi:hypothetical protein
MAEPPGVVRDLPPCPNTPVFCLVHDAYFLSQLDEALRLLSDKTEVRRILYGDDADDSLIGHTPPMVREKHSSLARQFIQDLRVSTPDSPEPLTPTLHHGRSPATPIGTAGNAIRKRKCSSERISCPSGGEAAREGPEIVHGHHDARLHLSTPHAAKRTRCDTNANTTTTTCGYSTPLSNAAHEGANWWFQVETPDTG